MPYQGERYLYSCRRNSAAINALEVWPDGKESVLLLSGRITPDNRFTELVMPEPIRFDSPYRKLRSTKLFFPFMPAKFRAYTAAAGASRVKLSRCRVRPS